MSITIREFLKRQASACSANALQDIQSVEDWDAVRAERMKEFQKCLGLYPLPAARDLQVRELGTFSGEGYTATKIGFEIFPDCWSSATIYYPTKNVQTPAPAVLYVCGHAKIGLWHYQYCPIMWARRGYVCLIVDTIEQHDNTGEHHGFLTNRQDLWMSLGYTSAGGEAWNSLVALRILRADPRVDANRIGVTGISGGGALSFYVAVLDPEIKAVASLCGISTPKDALVNGRFNRHCDCIYPYYLFQRDTSDYAALLAPKAALFCFGLADTLFCPDEAQAFVARTRKIYDLLGVPEKCHYLSHGCGHEDHAVFNTAVQKWFDHYVAGQEHPVLERGEREFSESQVSVFFGLTPRPDYTHLLPELLSPRGGLKFPEKAEDWANFRREACSNIPTATIANARFDLICRWDDPNGHRMSYDGVIDEVAISLELIIRKGIKKLLLGVAGHGESFQFPLARMAAGAENLSMAGFMPRVAGANFPAGDDAIDPPGSFLQGCRQTALRTLSILGHTPVSLAIADLQALLAFLKTLPELNGVSIYLYGRREMAVAALYAAVMDDTVAGLILEDMPCSHSDGVAILGILRLLDLPQAVGLVAPRPVSLVRCGHHNWNWPKHIYRLLGVERNFTMTDHLNEGVAAASR